MNKKRQVNFDEELIVIFFSILQYISETFGFRSNINYNFKLITGAKFQRYLNGFGRIRLRQIKYKYFSDTAVNLWNLCYAFFDKTYQIRMNSTQSEYLLVKSFHIVFEAMIDELIGTPHDKLPDGLADQYDGKIVDHLYTYDSLLIDEKADDDIYYIGDSKYYKIGNSLGTESIYKQRTYARNVIQWNFDIWFNGKQDLNDPFKKIHLFDEVTEGYNVIPNFFISATIDKKTLSYDEYIELHPIQPDISRQFKNRLYDRDTLLLSHYDVNFLFVLALYARNKANTKAKWRASVRDKFRTAVQNVLKAKFDFYALSAHPDVDASAYFKAHFQDTLGKTFRPYENLEIYSLALDKSFSEDNKRLLATLGENFYVVHVDLGDDPSGDLAVERATKRDVASPSGMGKFLFGIVTKNRVAKDGRKEITKEYMAFYNHEATAFVMRNMPSGDISEARFFVPIFDGGLSGYYDILGITFGIRKRLLLDDNKSHILDANGEEIYVPSPCLNIKLGAYHSLGDHTKVSTKIRNYNGQIHSFAEVMNLYIS